MPIRESYPTHSLDTWKMSSEETAAGVGLCSSMGGWLIVFTLLSISFRPKFQPSNSPRYEDVPWENSCTRSPSFPMSQQQSIEALLLFCPQQHPSQGHSDPQPVPELTVAASKIRSAVSKNHPDSFRLWNLVYLVICASDSCIDFYFSFW